jgi:hypothetical protein
MSKERAGKSKIQVEKPKKTRKLADKRMQSNLHPNTYKLIAEALAGASLTPKNQRPKATLVRLILLLESYGSANLVEPTTKVNAAAPDLDRLAIDINYSWSFPTGRGYQPREIDPTWFTQQLADDVNWRGGVLNGK